jgi:glutamate synthase domain-containing protein 2
LVVTLEELEELAGDGALQAAFDVPNALAVGGPAGGVGAGFLIITQPDERLPCAGHG